MWGTWAQRLKALSHLECFSEWELYENDTFKTHVFYAMCLLEWLKCSRHSWESLCSLTAVIAIEHKYNNPRKLYWSTVLLCHKSEPSILHKHLLPYFGTVIPLTSNKHKILGPFPSSLLTPLGGFFFYHHHDQSVLFTETFRENSVLQSRIVLSSLAVWQQRGPQVVNRKWHGFSILNTDALHGTANNGKWSVCTGFLFSLCQENRSAP